MIFLKSCHHDTAAAGMPEKPWPPYCSMEGIP